MISIESFEPTRAQVEIETLFLPDGLKAFTEKVYKQSATANRVITPDSKFCTVVNDTAAQILTAQGIRTDYLEHEAERGVATHAFVRIPNIKTSHGKVTFLLDLQYQQFIDPSKRNALLPAMAVGYTTSDHVIQGLTQHQIPREFHDYWLSELFLDQRHLSKSVYLYR